MTRLEQTAATTVLACTARNGSQIAACEECTTTGHVDVRTRCSAAVHCGVKAVMTLRFCAGQPSGNGAHAQSPYSTAKRSVLKVSTVIPRLTSDPANEFFG